MKRTSVFRWAVPALALVVPLGIGLRAIGQGGGSASAEVTVAKQMALLIDEGQINLRDATALAEKHVKGMALDVSCTIRQGAPEPTKSGKGDDQSAQADEASGGDRLIYTVTCFTKGKEEVHTVQVDGLAKKVMESQAGSGQPSRP